MTFRIPRLVLRLPCALLVALVAGGVVATATGAGAATDPDTRARAIVARMTLDEKVLEMHGIGGASPNIRKVPAVRRLGIPAFVITNGPAGATNGTVKPVPPATALPAPIGLAASWDLASATAYGQVAGSEARILGNDLLEGPDDPARDLPATVRGLGRAGPRRRRDVRLSPGRRRLQL